MQRKKRWDNSQFLNKTMYGRRQWFVLKEKIVKLEFSPQQKYLYNEGKILFRHTKAEKNSLPANDTTRNVKR